MSDLNPADYASVPGGPDAPGTIALGRKLLSVAPAGLTGYAEASRDTLRTAVQGLEGAYGVTLTAEPTGQRRPIDRATDNSWACTKSRLEPWTWLPERPSDRQDDRQSARHDELVESARALYRGLFPGGALAFTQLEFDKQWSEADARIGFLRKPGNEALLRQLIGDVFVDELLLWHARYTEMIGVAAAESQLAGKGTGRAKGRAPARSTPPATATAPSELRVAEQRRLAHQAIVAWQLTLVSLHLAGHPGARAALRPTDELRERLVSPAAAEKPDAPGPGPGPGPGPVPEPAPPAP